MPRCLALCPRVRLSGISISLRGVCSVLAWNWYSFSDASCCSASVTSKTARSFGFHSAPNSTSSCERSSSHEMTCFAFFMKGVKRRKRACWISALTVARSISSFTPRSRSAKLCASSTTTSDSGRPISLCTPRRSNRSSFSGVLTSTRNGRTPSPPLRTSSSTASNSNAGLKRSTRISSGPKSRRRSLQT
ncbi:hypothetical protein D9M72_267400 [compost metagenome]